MDRSHRDRVAFVRVLGPVRARHGRDPRADGPALRHQVRPLGVRAGARDARRGVPRRHRRPGQRHRRARRRRSTSKLPSSSPASPVRPRALRHGGRSTPGGTSSSARAWPSSTRRASSRCCATPTWGDQAPVFAAVGPMQLEVASWRLEHEFGSQAELSPTPYNVARRTDEASAPALRGMPGVRVLSGPTARSTPCSRARTGWVESESPELTLDRLVAEGTRAESRRQQVVPSSGTSRSTR